MSLTVINVNNEKWDLIVQSFKDSDVYYLREYSESFMIHGDGEPVLFYYESDNKKAINVVMKRQIRLMPEYYDIATPYGYGGWLLSEHFNDHEMKALDEAYSSYCISANIVSEFVRFHPLLTNAADLKCIYDVIDLGQTISIDLKDKELIWDNISSKNRNVIRKAIKSEVIINHSDSKETYNEFMNIYNQTMLRDQAEDYYYFKPDFYDVIREKLKDKSTVYYALKDNIIIGASIILFYNNNVHYHLSGAIKEYMSYAPMNLLLYQVACDYSDKGYIRMHLGGGIGSDSNSGLYKFKQSFNKQGTNQFSIGKKIFNEKIYDELLDIRKSKEPNFDFNNSYFPIYRFKEGSI